MLVPLRAIVLFAGVLGFASCKPAPVSRATVGAQPLAPSASATNPWQRFPGLPGGADTGLVMEHAEDGTVRAVFGGVRVEALGASVAFAKKMLTPRIERSCRVGTGWVHVTERNHVFASQTFLGELLPLGNIGERGYGYVWQCGPKVVTFGPGDALTLWDSEGSHALPRAIREIWFSDKMHGRAIGVPDRFLETVDAGRTFVEKATASSFGEWLGVVPEARPAAVEPALRARVISAWQRLEHPPEPDPVELPKFLELEGNTSAQSTLWKGYAGKPNPTTDVWHCHATPPMAPVTAAAANDDASRDASPKWYGRFGGTVLGGIAGESVRWRGRDERGPFETEAPISSAKERASVAALIREEANVDIITRRFLILQDGEAAGAHLRMLRADGTLLQLTTELGVELGYERLSDGSLLMASGNAHGKWDFVQLNVEGDIVARRSIVTQGDDIVRLAEGPAGPGFVLLHDGEFRLHSLIAAASGSVLPKPEALTLPTCAGASNHNNPRIFERFLSRLDLDGRDALPYFTPNLALPDCTRAIVELGKTGACLRGVRSSIRVLVDLVVERGRLHGQAFDSGGVHAVTCRNEFADIKPMRR